MPVITVEPRIWYNPQLRSTLFLVPGLIAYISMITAVVSTALSVVREKERGTMEQVRMAPVSPLPYILGKTLPYLVISFVSALLIILSAMALFDLPMRGSWLLLCLSIGLFLIGAQAQGLLISTIAETQQVAFQMALLSSLLPTMILSGFIFPISSMPIVVQAITHIVPARYFLVALRAIVLKGAGITAFWQELVALAIFATVALGPGVAAPAAGSGHETRPSPDAEGAARAAAGSAAVRRRDPRADHSAHRAGLRGDDRREGHADRRSSTPIARRRAAS